MPSEGITSEELLIAPATPGALHAWISRVLGLTIARRAIIRGHGAPLEYLCHSFFETGRGAGGAPDCVVWANRGGGKTFLGALATLLDLLFKPGIEVRILGGSMDQSRRMYTHLRRFFGAAPLAGQVSGKITERRLALVNGSEVELLSQSQTSVRGTRVQKLRCDEVDLFDPDVWEAAQLATRSKQCGETYVHASVECLSTMHRPHGVMHRLVKEAGEGRRALFKWGVVDVLERCPERYECSRASVGVGGAGIPPPGNGGAGVPPVSSETTTCPLWDECKGRAKTHGCGHIAIADAINMKRRVALATWEAEMLCLRPRRTNAVLPEFDPAVHVVAREPAPGDTWIAGMDFGYRAPTVVLLARVDAGNTLWIEHERVVAGEVLRTHIDAIKASLGSGAPAPEWIGVDPAGRSANDQTGKDNISLMKNAGLAVCTRGMKILAGLALVRARLRPAHGEPRLYINPRCTHLIEAMEKYHYDENNAESISPVKDGPDHAVDALRYLVQNLDNPVKTSTANHSPTQRPPRWRC